MILCKKQKNNNNKWAQEKKVFSEFCSGSSLLPNLFFSSSFHLFPPHIFYFRFAHLPNSFECRLIFLADLPRPIRPDLNAAMYCPLVMLLCFFFTCWAVCLLFTNISNRLGFALIFVALLS
jgi:hypothetical protein